jgi:hypothetical protein
MRRSLHRILPKYNKHNQRMSVEFFIPLFKLNGKLLIQTRRKNMHELQSALFVIGKYKLQIDYH